LIFTHIPSNGSARRWSPSVSPPNLWCPPSHCSVTALFHLELRTVLSSPPPTDFSLSTRPPCFPSWEPLPQALGLRLPDVAPGCLSQRPRCLVRDAPSRNRAVSSPVFGLFFIFFCLLPPGSTACFLFYFDVFFSGTCGCLFTFGLFGTTAVFSTVSFCDVCDLPFTCSLIVIL